MTALNFTDDDLAEGRRLVAALDGSQWALGDLAVRVAGPSTFTHAHDGSTARLSFFADAIGLHHEQLGRYRSVACAWPPQTRVPGASWTLHRTLAPLPERDRHTILSEFIIACEAGGARPTRDLLLTKLRTKPILPEEEPNVLPSAAALAADPPTVTVSTERARVAPDEPDPEVVRVDAPDWMVTELARIRIASDRPVGREPVDLTVNEAMTQFYELDIRVRELNEYRRQLLFSIVAQRPSWWPELEPKLDEMDAAEQWLVG